MGIWCVLVALKGGGLRVWNTNSSSFSPCMQESFLASVFPTPALALAPPPLAGVQT